MKSKKELLNPRFLVLGNYPRSYYNVGDIIDGDTAFLIYGTDEKEADRFSLSDFPLLFKELKWWEERNIEDMPEYISAKPDNYNNVVFKIIKWVEDRYRNYWYATDSEKYEMVIDDSIVPSTLEEYTEYQNSLTWK